MSLATDRMMRDTLPTPPERILIALTSLFVLLLVLTNIIGNKLMQVTLPILGSGAVFSGILTYPFTFWCTDLVSELYGKRRADYMVILGFAFSLLVFLVLGPIVVAIKIFPVEKSEIIQQAFEIIFAMGPRLMVGSMTAYVVAQLTDNYLYHFWRRVTKGKYLWIRNNGSTLISQMLDTIIVTSIFLFRNPNYADIPYLPSELADTSVVQIIIFQYTCKAIMAVVDTPFIYAGVYALRGFVKPEKAIYKTVESPESHD